MLRLPSLVPHFVLAALGALAAAAARRPQNRILSMEKSIPVTPNDVAARIAQQTLAARGADYSVEVRRLLDAGREVMRRNGTSARARVADIVAAAGLSNEAFYRHFTSKDALVAAILEDGTERLKTYLGHQMEREITPEGQVRRWVEGVLSQASNEAIAATALAVLWNGGSLTAQRAGPSAPLATLLRAPFAELGSADPELDASLAAHAIIGKLTDHLWGETRPTNAETDHGVAFCLGAVTRRAPATAGEC
ncbi:MAG: helix-turn-helix domain-containing protein [Acidimicrobiales bacterium]